jgi:thymidylate synthase (FAD)
LAEFEFVSEPKVTLVNASMSDDMVAMAAWVSHDQDSEERLDDKHRVAKLINFLYTNKHMSPFEHGHMTVKVDAPLFVAREWHRHRTQSYNEVSGRYTEMKPRFFRGTTARVQKGKPGAYYFEDGTEEQTAIYLTSKQRVVDVAWEEYERRLEAGIAKEQAREDLPLSLMTQFYATANPRNWMQFLTLRTDKTALKEIRDVAYQVEYLFKHHMPLTYSAYAGNMEKAEEKMYPRIVVQGTTPSKEYLDRLNRVVKDMKK